MQSIELEAESIDFIKKSCKNVDNIILNDKFLQLKDIGRHKYTNTYDHSIRVAVGAAIIADKLGGNVESAIRVGLLHDMCFVKREERKTHGGHYNFYHPIEAAENADKEFGITVEEQRAIKAHMFPIAARIPTSRIALALTLSDKLVAIYEGLYGVRMLRNMMISIYARSFEPVVLQLAYAE